MPRAKKTSTDSQPKLILSVKERTLFGKKLKKLRKEKYIPSNIYGQGFKSKAVSIDTKEFIRVYKIAKETGVVYAKLDQDEIPILIKNLQRHPVNDTILHIDLRKIDLKKSIETEVPVKIVGTSEAVSQKGGVLLTHSETLMIEALPEHIPHEIVVDIGNLKEIGQEIKVADLPKSPHYGIKNPAEKVVISVVEHKEESVTPETAQPVAPEVLTEKTPPEEAPTPEKGAAEEKQPS